MSYELSFVSIEHNTVYNFVSIRYNELKTHSNNKTYVVNRMTWKKYAKY